MILLLNRDLKVVTNRCLAGLMGVSWSFGVFFAAPKLVDVGDEITKIRDHRMGCLI